MHPPAATTLRGEVVRLEPLDPTHEAGIHAAADADVSAFRVSGPGVHDEGVSGWFAQALAEATAGGRLPFAVLLTDGSVVGSSSYLDIAPADGRIEIGNTWYGGPWQGTSVNPATKLLLLAHAFDELGATRVTLKTDARNEQSRRAILGIGAQLEGVMRKHSRRQDGPGLRDVALFSVTDDDWPAVRALLEERVRRTGAR